MSNVRRHLETSLEDPEFRKEREEQAPERELMNLIIEARIAEGMTQAELAEACGMKASNLCRIESGNGNPSLATLSRIARGLGRRLEIRFV